MKHNTRYILLMAVLILTACSDRENLNAGQGSLDLGNCVEMTLEGVSLSNETATRAEAVSSPMTVGSTFRLYAFEEGKADPGTHLLTTRTYTIKSTAGVPVLDDGQQPLALPVGKIDVYLVGPTGLATAYAVTPVYGKDLVSSKTTLTVTAKGGKFKVNALTHKMAKMEVCVNRHINHQYENLLVSEVKVTNQVTQGLFVFGDGGGSITPAIGGTESIISDTVIAVEKGEKYKATFYMIPRAQNEMSLEVFFTCNRPYSAAVIERRLSSGKLTGADSELKAGMINRYTTQPELPDKTIWRITLYPWNEVDMGEQVVSDADLLFVYSGMDAPENINGKMCWRDRSGNGNHAEIVNMTYDTERHAYFHQYAGNKSYFQLPSLGQVGAYTLELTVESCKGAEIWSAAFGGSLPNGTYQERSLNVHTPWENNVVYMDAGGFQDERRAGKVYSASDLSFMEIMSTYAFQHDGTYTYIFRNGKNEVDKHDVLGKPYGEFKDNKLWRLQNAVGVGKCRIYAARLYRKKLDQTGLKQNYLNDVATFAGVHTDGNSYIKNGLVLNLDGSKAGNSPSTLWVDQSGNGNDAKIYNRSLNGTINYMSGSNCYTFPGRINGNEIADSFMQLSQSLGTMQEYTIEFVAQPTSANSSVGNAVICFASKEKTDQDREINFHLPWDRKFFMQSPYRRSGADNAIEIATTSLPYPNYVDKVYQYSGTRRDNRRDDGIVVKQNLKLIGTTSTFSQLKEMKFCYIGAHPVSKTLSNTDGLGNPFGGRIYAIRLYNRVLTDKEQQINYEIDKKKYQILP